jgi:hypothetical protein
MITIEVEVSGIEEALRFLDIAEKEWPEVQKQGLEWLGAGFVAIESAFINKEVGYTGELADSVGFEISGDTVTIGPNVPSGGVDEGKIAGVLHGARPRWVSLSRLGPWAAKKLGSEDDAEFLQRRIAGVIPGQPGGTSTFQLGIRGEQGFPFPQESLDLPETQDMLNDTAQLIAEYLVSKFI